LPIKKEQTVASYSGYSLTTYVAVFILLQVINPILSYYLYERSKDYIR
jgi:hypothetical protein